MPLLLLFALACGPRSAGIEAAGAPAPAVLAERRVAEAARLEARLDSDRLSAQERADTYIALGQLRMEQHWEDEVPDAAIEAQTAYLQAAQLGDEISNAAEAQLGLAYATQARGHEQEAVKHASSLVRTWPESEQVQEAYVFIGDHYFDQNNAFKALLAYQKATRYEEGALSRYARYRLAWCYYNVGEYGKAIESLQSLVVDAGAAAAESLEQDGQDARLVEASLQDLARFYADAGQVEEGTAWLVEAGSPEVARAVGVRAAEIYADMGRFEEAAAAYRVLVAGDPRAPEALDYQHHRVIALAKVGDFEGEVKALEALRREFGPGSAWARANPDRAAEARAVLDTDLRACATRSLWAYQRAPRHLQDGRALERAESLLLLWLAEFPGHADTPAALLELAEVYHLQQKPGEAERALQRVLKEAPDSKEADKAAEELGYR